MFTSQPEEWDDPHVIALVELDMQKMRVRIVLSREAIRERLQRLEYPLTTTTGTQAVQALSKNREIVNELLETEAV